MHRDEQQLELQLALITLHLPSTSRLSMRGSTSRPTAVACRPKRVSENARNCGAGCGIALESVDEGCGRRFTRYGVALGGAPAGQLECGPPSGGMDRISSRPARGRRPRPRWSGGEPDELAVWRCCCHFCCQRPSGTNHRCAPRARRHVVQSDVAADEVRISRLLCVPSTRGEPSNPAASRSRRYSVLDATALVRRCQSRL